VRSLLTLTADPLVPPQPLIVTLVDALAAPRRAAIVIAACAGMIVAPGHGNANGVPTAVELRYLDGLSNWGPSDATGRLELSFAEGYARVRAQRLPALERGRYQGWLVNSETNDAISAGRFNADASGVATLDGTLPLITNFGFDLFILTVEPEPDDAPQPTTNRSIGGRFAIAGTSALDQRLPGDVTNRPGQLPTTGEAPLLPDVIRGAALLGALGASGLLGLRLGRRSA
jgi:hypothetical protein